MRLRLNNHRGLFRISRGYGYLTLIIHLNLGVRCFNRLIRRQILSFAGRLIGINRLARLIFWLLIRQLASFRIKHRIIFIHSYRIFTINFNLSARRQNQSASIAKINMRRLTVFRPRQSNHDSYIVLILHRNIAVLRRGYTATANATAKANFTAVIRQSNYNRHIALFRAANCDLTALARRQLHIAVGANRCNFVRLVAAVAADFLNLHHHIINLNRAVNRGLRLAVRVHLHVLARRRGNGGLHFLLGFRVGDCHRNLRAADRAVCRHFARLLQFNLRALPCLHYAIRRNIKHNIRSKFFARLCFRQLQINRSIRTRRRNFGRRFSLGSGNLQHAVIIGNCLGYFVLVIFLG